MALPIHVATLFSLLMLVLIADHVVTEKVRMITKEELATKDGNQTKELWLSIMSKVYDVSKGAEYYAPGSPYHVFVGKDANVPFITGAFNPEEANKPLTDLTPHQLMNLETWMDFYEKEDKYPFIGLLEGDLYDKDGNPTEMMGKVQEMVKEGKAAQEEQKRKREEVLARRKREDAEKAKQNMGQKPKPAQPKVVNNVIEPLETVEEL